MFQSHAFFSAYWQCSNCLFIYSGHYHQMGNKTIGQIVDVIHILLNYMEANYIIYCTYGSYIHINTENSGSKSIQSLSHCRMTIAMQCNLYAIQIICVGL